MAERAIVPYMADEIKAVLFDFGGVIAEEGFREGLTAIGKRNSLDPERFFSEVDRLIYDTGYLTGVTDEATFWDTVRKKTGITGSDKALREEILARFALRPVMLAHADRLRAAGLKVAMLSDQTNWLEEIDRKTLLFGHFDIVFNSFRLHESKRDRSIFRNVCRVLGVRTDEALFVDDNIGHIKRAESEGLRTLHFTTINEFEKRIVIFLAPGGEEIKSKHGSPAIK
ncbi:MAG TPA: HAD family phosphatase [Nitrospirota bacterium]|nr:HAD family phosphatase [Nitrospirota bacterium]